MPIKILERMLNSSPRGLSQAEEAERLGLRGGGRGQITSPSGYGRGCGLTPPLTT